MAISRRPAPDRAPTMKDIARVSGVSQSTVSRILTATETIIPVSPATRDRVMAVARELDYRPNPLARGLRGAPTMLLGVIVREITDPFFAEAIDAITAEANAQGYSVILGHAHGKADEAIAMRAVFETRHCDALVFAGDLRDEPRLLADLASASVRSVGLWQGASLPGIPTINVDDRAGMRAVIDHLAALGHRRIAFIGGRFGDGESGAAGAGAGGSGADALGDIRVRRLAFEEHLAELGLPLPPPYLREAPNTFAGGSAALGDLAALPEPPTAVVASTDVMAVGALHGAYRLGLTVPGDLSVTGFDDLAIAAHSVPPLTTVHQPIREMAAAAVRAAIGGGEPAEALLAPSLVIRDSSGRAPAR